jgi:hypothetical protein
MEGNVDGPVNFRGKDPAPYQLTSASVATGPEMSSR